MKQKGKVVVSLFDGIACGRIALERAGHTVLKYYASEIDKYAIQVAKKNYPDIIQLGDITEWRTWDIDWTEVDLIMGGSPCQGFSVAGKGLNFEDPRSKLFFVFMDILNYVRSLNPDVKFLLENVRMKKDYQEIINEYIGVEPILINSALVSAQSRKRLYWTNIPNVTQPEDKGIVLIDILENNLDVIMRKLTRRMKGNIRHYRDKAKTLMASMYKGEENNGMTLVPVDGHDVVVYQRNRGTNPGGLKALDGKTPSMTSSAWEHNNLLVKGPIRAGTAADIRGHDSVKRIYDTDGKSPTLTTCGGGHREPKIADDVANIPALEDKSYCITARYNGAVAWNSIERKQRSMIPFYRSDNEEDPNVVNKFYYRKLTPVECERLQTIPDNYTDGVSKTQRYKALGNGWTVDVVTHIFKNLK